MASGTATIQAKKLKIGTSRMTDTWKPKQTRGEMKETTNGYCSNPTCVSKCSWIKTRHRDGYNTRVCSKCGTEFKVKR